ncbi:MAG TPA: HAD hydrolase-like protein [Anaerolineae bacterium]|nr:HAD hydrolase-like protein [Anaerolineae bacterium]
MKYRLVIFDFDGTLANSFPWMKRIFNELAEKYKIRPLTDEEEHLLRGYTADQIIKHFDVPAWRIPQAIAYVRKLMAQEIHHIPLFEGIHEMLQHLAERGATLAVVSSNAEENVRQVLGPENAALIRYYEGGVALFGKAPKLRKVLAKSGVRPADALYIGDEIRDIEAAHEVHMAVGAVTWGYNHAEVLQAYAPEEMFASVAEIVEKII